MVAALITRTQPSLLRSAVCLDLGLATAVPGRRGSVVQGRIGWRRGQTAQPRRCRTRHPTGVHDHGRPRHAAGIATAGAAGLDPTTCWELLRQEKTDTVVVVSGDRDLLRWSPTTRSRFGCCTWGGASRRRNCSDEEVAAKYGVPADRAGAPTQNSPYCVVIRRTDCPGEGVGEKTRVHAAAAPRLTSAICGGCRRSRRRRRKGNRAKLDAAADYLDAALPVVRVRHRRRRSGCRGGRPAACARRLGATRPRSRRS